MLAGNELGAVQPDAKIRAQRQRRTQYPFEKSRLDLENLRLERRHDCNGPRSRRSFAEQDHSSRLEIGPLSPLEWSCSRSEEHTSELQSHLNLVCRLLLEKKKK